MKKLLYVVLIGTVIAGLGFMVKDRVFSQEGVTKPSDALEVLRDKSLRTTEPRRVIAAIEEVTARVASTESKSIPSEVLSALVDLLDFERPDKGTIEGYDITEGQKVYPVMGALVYMSYMRKPVLPALVDVIENEDTKSVKSQNALKVIQEIVGNGTLTFNFLLVQSGNAKSEVGEERILSAARSVLKGENRRE